ncbi:hypothetical protein SLUN_01150 [Streptomyces lunaelactis]|uniref:Uncharacterized protein n=1 Tax=Streptomyces lunaelactis TaxID=1535768 RepID=A0A2R4SW01_9ACTN|nr:hypothetical protein [Streptomyces lunaelactis]AVZ71063.1 hypothetical protein SLUN_01150 [Streptomyces lunaelactis]NUK22646.1 hypothetical protein [Streptomyces lunaelactis]NUK87040.1 hypothetical protein [Streptomyces lunaelactis]
MSQPRLRLAPKFGAILALVALPAFGIAAASTQHSSTMAAVASTTTTTTDVPETASAPTPTPTPTKDTTGWD